MNFEKSPLCACTWEPVDLDALRRELTDEQIDMMVCQKATIRTATSKYRRRIPAKVIDWAKEEVPA